MDLIAHKNRAATVIALEPSEAIPISERLFVVLIRHTRQRPLPVPVAREINNRPPS